MCIAKLNVSPNVVCCKRQQNKGIIQSILCGGFCTCTSRSAFGHYADRDVVSSWRDDLVVSMVAVTNIRFRQGTDRRQTINDEKWKGLKERFSRLFSTNKQYVYLLIA